MKTNFKLSLVSREVTQSADVIQSVNKLVCLSVGDLVC